MQNKSFMFPFLLTMLKLKEDLAYEDIMFITNSTHDDHEYDRHQLCKKQVIQK